MIRPRPATSLLAPALLLAACVTLPPKTPQPTLRPTAPVVAAPASTPTGQWPEARWWLRYQDDTLTTLIERALEHAPSMAAAAARFDSAQQQLRLADAARGVQIDASATARRERLSDNGMLSPAFLGFNWYAQVDLGARARYSLDWWGRQRAEIAAAVAARSPPGPGRRGRHWPLRSRTRTSAGDDQARLALARERLELADHQLRITSARVGAGLDRDDAAQRATAQRADAQEQVALIEGATGLRRVVLAALTGCAPADLPPLAARPLPATSASLPQDLGIDLIGRRADITASRWRVEAAFEGVKAARAEFLPDISLNALAALSSIDYGKLFEAGSRAPAVGAAVHLPVFDSGALRAQHAARRATLRAAVANYDATLITAAREVGQQLVLRQQIDARMNARTAQAGARPVAAAGRRVQQGLGDIRPQLDAARSMLEQRAANSSSGRAVAADIALIRRSAVVTDPQEPVMNTAPDAAVPVLMAIVVAMLLIVTASSSSQPLPPCCGGSSCCRCASTTDAYVAGHEVNISAQVRGTSRSP
jgi:multidrug efflux system outer membrane protein